MSAIAGLCPASLYTGSCADSGCGLRHNAKFCETCAVICNDANIHNAHTLSNKHLRLSNRTTPGAQTYPLLCIICNLGVSGEEDWLQHVATNNHRTALSSRGSTAQPVYPRDGRKTSDNRCILCHRSYSQEEWRPHLHSKAHRRQETHALFRAQFEAAELDRGDVTVSHRDTGIDFGVVGVAEATRGIPVKLSVGRNRPSPGLRILGANVTTTSPKKVSAFSVSVPGQGGVAIGSQPVELTVTFKTDRRSRFEARLEITLQKGDHKAFIVTRGISAIVGNREDRELLKPVEPYTRRRRVQWHSSNKVFSGDRPPIDELPWVRKLPKSLIPPSLQDIIGKGTDSEQVALVKAKLLPKSLKNEATHTPHFRVLLWIEEQRAAKDLEEYDMSDVTFGQEGRLYTLVVPGLAEKRPSVVVGDTVKVQVSNAPADRTYEGFVHDVRQGDIRISFHRSFNGASQHFNALVFPSKSWERLLVPTPAQAGLLRAILAGEHYFTPRNPLVARNPRQFQAVQSILRLRTGAAPFIIFGPPGTGKTVTMVEGILQILDANPDARILACAPSNSAADILAQRLAAALTTAELFRCNAAMREVLTVDPALVPYTLRHGAHYAIPPLETLKKYKVIVSTCGNASFAYNIDMPHDHFTHVFVDEAGQASEPEVLNAIKTTVARDTRVILAGDPKQLGPVIRSSVARELGLGKSYLERLMERDVYKGQNGHGTSYVKLVKNFRSHRAIIQFPNEKFYDGELEVCGDPGSINAFVSSKQLVARDFPVVFHAIAGGNEREASSPSYFNIDEATEVKEYILALLKDRTHPLKAKDIGVITPYRAQVRKVRMLLRQASVEGVTVGSTEEFQGQERRVIIVSTVRSSKELLQFDAKFTLGFVANPRRFNVAVTRAKALLIVIGDPNVLSIDPLWREFMNYAFNKGGWRGGPPTWDPSVPVRTDVDYAEEIREAGAAELEDFVARMVQQGDGNLEAEVNNAEGPFEERD